MVSVINKGIMDMIGAARPSIADPFLPKKIEEGRIEDIRECIGCNICVGWDTSTAPMRCTQNPTKGEEWRKGWHPEVILPRSADETVLIVGGGPAGLEAARALGQRGYEVTLSDASTELGGRVTHESRLPGLAAWARVRDYRVYQIQQMSDVLLYPASPMSAGEVLEFGADHVAIATGARWRKDGYGRAHQAPIPGSDGAHVLTPDDIMAGVAPDGPVLVYDDDHYYIGGLIAEKLCADGKDVVLVTPESKASAWTDHTLEQHRIQARLLELGVVIVASHTLAAIGTGEVTLACLYTKRERKLAAASIVMATSRLPVDSLYWDLMADNDALADAGVKSIKRIGDCYGPATIAAAVYEGHRYARELGAEPVDGIPFRRELTELSADF
jgi:dimethylamine/trimethylamine dehydrogenase